MMNVSGNLIIVTLAAVSLTACSSDPRSMAYFIENPEEARNLIEDRSACAGPDRSKILSGEDECTNAHQAINRLEAEEYNERQRKANSNAAKSGGFTPSVTKR